MGVETPPKYVNRELNSQIGVRGQNSHIELSDGAPPKYVNRELNSQIGIRGQN
jgi:hypothetical protein